MVELPEVRETFIPAAEPEAPDAAPALPPVWWAVALALCAVVLPDALECPAPACPVECAVEWPAPACPVECAAVCPVECAAVCPVPAWPAV